MTLRLTVCNGQFEGVNVEVTDIVSIGRAQDAGLVLPDPQVSRNHVEVWRDEAMYWVKDMGSHNGTYVNDIKLDNKRLLRNGDVIRVGNTSLEVQAPEDSASSSSKDIKLEEAQGDVTMTVERNARELSPPTIDSITSPNAALDRFSAPTANRSQDDSEEKIDLVATDARHFAILFHVSKSLQESTDTDRLLAIMMDHVFKVMKADRGEIVLVNPQTEELVPVLSMDRNGQVADTIRVSKTVVRKVLNSRMAVISTDAPSDPRLKQSESIIMYGMRSIMCVPMISHEKILGIVQVVNDKDMAAFTDDDLYLLTVIASLAAISIENARLYERQKEALDDARLAHEELVKTQEELIHQEKLASVGQLATGIAHEIKNSLGPMSLVHLLKERHPDDEILQEYANMILESHYRILSIISEVRNFTKGESESYETRIFPLHKLLESVLNFLKFDRDVKRSNVRLHIHEMVDAKINADRIKQVVINLIRNAVQALPEADGRVDVVLAREDNEAFIRVIDNGCGIPEENLESIWTPFFTTKQDRGMGLGLDISRMIIQQHGGRLECSSVPGKGTTMNIILPVAE